MTFVAIASNAHFKSRSTVIKKGAGRVAVFAVASFSSSSGSCRQGMSSFRRCASAFSQKATSTTTRSQHRFGFQQKRSFFRSSRDHNQGHSKHQHRGGGGSYNYNKHSYNSRFFENQDPGLRWTATLSNPASVEGPGEDIPSRAEQLERLQNEDEEYDVLIIGGGATGAGIALDAASRGLKTACIERGDFSSETSSRSTKLIWAGIKYMASAVAALVSPKRVWDKGIVASCQDFAGEMRMVYHCHVERRYMTTENKHLCTWLPIAVPFPSWIMDPPPLRFPFFAIFPLVAPVVFKIYDGLSGFTCPPSYVLRPSSVEKVFPQLDASKMVYCAVFYEAQHNDARTNLAIALTAAKHGAHICNYVAAVDLTKHKQGTGKVTGAIVVDRMTDKTFHIKAKKVVFAGGPFTDNLRAMELNKPTEDDKQGTEGETLQSAVEAAHGSHVVLPGHLMPQGGGAGSTDRPMGLLDCCPSDGRFLFVVPWLGHTLAGTTDVKGQAETLPLAPQDDIDWLLKESSKYWKPELKSMFTTQQVMSSWRGWRPLAMDPHAAAGDQVSRDHVISEHPETGVVFIAGGKWTTWREMAQDVVDRITSAPCQTLKIPLLGAAGYSDTLSEQVQTKYPHLDRDICDHLVATYGGHVWDVCALLGKKNNDGLDRRLADGYPYVEAEVIYACREYACSVEDILSRRTRLACLNYQAALQAIPRVAQLMQGELKWTRTVMQQQVQAAQTYVETYGGATAWSDPTEK